MSNSLRDELLRAGLVSQERLEAAKASKRRPGGAPRKARGRPAAAQSAAPAAALRPDKARRAEVREFLRKKRRNVADAPLPFHFVEGRVIRKIWVTAEQKAALAAGDLLIASRNERHYLLDRKDGETLLALDPGAVLIRPDTGADDDPAYAAHPVPDDLQW